MAETWGAREELEWLEADGLGGFASGTVAGIRTRRYHALLLVARTPPSSRVVLVNGVEAWVESPARRSALSSHRYAPGVIHPDGATRIREFTAEPWPTWTYRTDDGLEIVHGVMSLRDVPAVALSWRLVTPVHGVRLSVRLLMSGRDLHALHRENSAFRFDALSDGISVSWRPYDVIPAIRAQSNGVYEHAPLWFRNYLYSEEAARGLDCIEDLASPGILNFELDEAEAILILSASSPAAEPPPRGSAEALLRRMRASEHRRRDRFPSRLHRAADDYIVRRGTGRSIIAGYPWFADWGRDTFIALRGCCLETGRLSEARQILLQWAAAVSEGMVPNYFPELGQLPEFNAVDASLWFIVAIHDFFAAVRAAGKRIAAKDRKALDAAMLAILEGYARGTRHGIHADTDGLLAAGESGRQLTWMDAKVGDRVVTPRIGKPVEVQALWLNALRIGAALAPKWSALYDRAERAFAARFWNEHRGSLYDVVDVNHVSGTVDDCLRPNQIFAVGGLPFPVLDLSRARRVVDIVHRELWTPVGLRSLAPGEPGYAPGYGGAPHERDSQYHMGLVWPWLAGPFVEAWLRVHGSAPEVRTAAREEFLAPLLAQLDLAGLGHISELADAEPPFTPRGAPFQAWSVGEALRIVRMVRAQQHPTPAELASTLGTRLDG
jgi:predicted glycogen debranching enzyme